MDEKLRQTLNELNADRFQPLPEKNPEEPLPRKPKKTVEKKQQEKPLEVFEALPREEQKIVEQQVGQDIVKEEIEKNPDAQKGSLKSKFLEALTYMAPQIGGALIGGIIGGAKGVEAGYQTGTGIRKQLDEQSNQMTRLDIERARLNQANMRFNQVSRADDVLDTRTGETLFSTRTGQMINQKGEVVDPKYQRSLKAELREQGNQRIDIAQANTQLRESLGYANIGERIKSREFREQEAQDLGAAQLKEVVNAETAINQTRVVMSQLEGPTIGPIAGRVQSMAQVWTGKSDPEFTKLKTNTELLLQNYGKAISGTAMSDNERKRIEETLPSIKDSPKVFMIKAKEFERQLQNIRDTNLRASKKYQGRGMGVPSLEDKKKRMEELRKKAGR